MWNVRYFLPFLCGAALTVMIAVPARADITEVQKLRFGTWAVTDNDSQHYITVNVDGSYNHSSELVEISPPQVGIYSVTDLPGFYTVGSVTVTVNYPMQSGGGPDFTLDNFTTQIPPTNGLGATTLTLGARARTSGSGQNYGDDTYTGELHIEINL